MTDWKRPLLIGIGWGIGTSVSLAILFAGFYWYESRPKPPEPWNTSAIVAIGPPSFVLTDDGKRVQLTYSLENTTGSDYQIASQTDVKVTGRLDDGILSAPATSEQVPLDLPVFIPAKQKALLNLSVPASDIPRQQKASETDEQFHERLRAFLNKNFGIKEIVLFDERNRYQIDLPRWLRERPKSP